MAGVLERLQGEGGCGGADGRAGEGLGMMRCDSVRTGPVLHGQEPGFAAGSGCDFGLRSLLV